MAITLTILLGNVVQSIGRICITRLYQSGVRAYKEMCLKQEEKEPVFEKPCVSQSQSQKPTQPMYNFSNWLIALYLLQTIDLVQ